MKNIFFFLLGVSVVVGLVILTSYTDNEPDSNGLGTNNTAATQAPKMTNGMVQQVYAPKLPDTMVFIDEIIDLRNFDVQERIEHEILSICFRHSATIGVIKRSSRYFPIIEPILKENGVPDDMKYLAITESELANVVSPAGAAGFWQFMKATAGGYDMEVGAEIDERYHLEKATKAACDLLKKNKEKFGDWLLAAAAYNMGAGGLDRDMTAQKMDNYFDLYLNRETSRYVPRLFAYKEMLENAEKYGIHVDAEDKHPNLPEFRTVKVSGAVANWGDFAKENGTSYRALRVYNPWIRSSKLTNKYGKTYEVKIPVNQ